MSYRSPATRHETNARAIEPPASMADKPSKGALRRRDLLGLQTREGRSLNDGGVRALPTIRHGTVPEVAGVRTLEEVP